MGVWFFWTAYFNKGRGGGQFCTKARLDHRVNRPHDVHIQHDHVNSAGAETSVAFSFSTSHGNIIKEADKNKRTKKKRACVIDQRTRCCCRQSVLVTHSPRVNYSFAVDFHLS